MEQMEIVYKEKLIVYEVSCIIIGYGTGSGVLTMPYIANKCGYPVVLLIFSLSFGSSFLLHLMIPQIVEGLKGDTKK